MLKSDVFGIYRGANMKLQDKIKHLRKKKGISQQELADLASINISYVSRLENGHHEPSIDLVRNFMKIFEVSADYLLDEEAESYEIKIQDKNLAEKVKLIDTLDEDERNALSKIIDSMLTNHKMRQILGQGTERAGADQEAC